ncbi:LOW QUALITY PROTEIN: uncharacterized protein LOC117898950 [Drosophila subobscura]|uniref:LOW QUALITY PROTEIN: uncharacterized protein LOC117898950 n=1 Tax=Drosophila subobscura TaxID=7241 RepID=UPI00155A0A53|nr:LOW QUALITY PROTEIN: uncharacterized protein LOC117898950 [Drosophila subobscura]
MVGKLKVCIIGSEGWGSAIAASVSNNVKQLEGFDSRAHIYVYDELVRSKYLSEVMNNCHENIKYLPGIRLPENLIAVNDLLAAAQNADILIFATPQHFVKSYCNILAGKVKENAIALSMVKGLAHVSDGEIDLYSNLISQQLDIPCYSLMSANSAMEMAQGKLCELTIGCNDEDDARLLTEVLQTDNCRVITVDDVDGVELCGTLKDIIALGAGFVDGLKLGENARVASLHLGVKEMMRFTMTFYPNAKISTFFESCAVANSVASTYVDKNVTFAKSFITSGKTIQEIESNLLNGRKLLGPLVAAELNTFLEEEDMQDEFPLFTAIHRICQNEVDPETILETLRTHPDLSSSLSFSQFLSDESTTEDSLEKILEPPPEPISALDKALTEAGKKKSFRELKENGSWHLVYDVNKAKKQTSIDPWQINERKGLQISGWLESNDSNEPKNASGTQGSGENESIVGSTSGSDDCQGIGCTENAEKTEKLPVDKTWLRDQPPPMIIGSDDKSNTETPFKDSNMAKVDAAETKESCGESPQAANLQVTAEDKQQEQAEDVKMSESIEENKAVPREQQQDSLREENFEKWKQVEAEERPAKHSQTEENMYLSAEELIRRELEHHQKENHERDAMPNMPQTPVPGPKQTPAKAPPPTPKRQKIAEGSPQFQAAPRTIPPPSPQTLPLTPQEQQPHRKHLPIQSDALEQPPASHQADESAKAARGQKGIIETPAATREAHSPSDQQATNKAEAPAFEVKKLMTHFLKREQPETTKQVETPPNEVKNQRESAYELVNDPRTATKEHKPLPEDNAPPIEKPSAQASPKEQKQLKAGEMTKKLRSMLRRDQEKKVGYKGKNPFLKEPDLQSHPPMDTSLEHDLARRRSTGQQLRRTVVVKPPFNPPLNPRVRIPRPPFDGRDREYHTLAMPAIWLNLKQTQTQTTMRANNQVKQLSMAVHSPPKLQLPLGLLPRCSALNKLLCAVQIGLLATFLARCRNRNK